MRWASYDRGRDCDNSDKNNSGCQAPPGRCAWGAWGCAMGAQVCVICGFIYSCHRKVRKGRKDSKSIKKAPIGAI